MAGVDAATEHEGDERVACGELDLGPVQQSVAGLKAAALEVII